MAFPDAYPMLSNATAQPQRRLSSRRTSSAAQDPFGRLSLTAASGPADSVSRLTIVRVPQSAVSEDGSAGRGSAPPSRPNSALGSRPGSAASSYREGGREPGRPVAPTSGGDRMRESSAGSRDGDRVRRSSWGSASGDPATRGRMSFAFSSFTPIHPPASQQLQVQTQGQASGPTSPIAIPGASPGSGTGFAGSFGTSHQRVRTQSSTSSAAPRHVNLTPQQTVDLAINTTTHAGDDDYETPTIAELSEQDHLPFLDRCAEVNQLITAPGPTYDLFKLLRQTFPFPTPNSKDKPLLPLPEPTKWTYEQLVFHLTQVDRSQCPDAEWSRMLRICIRSHSEALWERVKGALGIPPELEVEDVMDDPSQAWELYDFGSAADADPSELFDVDDINTDSPFEARLEPIHQGDSPLLSPTVGAALSPNIGTLSSSMSISMMPDLAELREEEEEAEGEDDNLSDKADGDSRSPSPVGSNRSGASGASSKPIHGLRITTASSSASGSGSSSLAPTPLATTPIGTNGGAGSNLSRAFSTGSIRSGLARLKMTPLSPAMDNSGNGARNRSSLGMGSGQPAASQPGVRPRGATVNVGSLPGASGAAAAAGTTAREQRIVSEGTGTGRGAGTRRPSEGVFHPLAERGPGNPLFPSSFSRLSLSPTLSANNPALRNPQSLDPHPSAYLAQARRRHSRTPSWADGMLEGRDAGDYEYAVTVGSGSSVYGD